MFRFLLTVRFDMASERAGIDDVLVRADIRQSPAELTAVLVSWLVLLAALVGAVSVLGLNEVSLVLTRGLDYAPLAFGLGCKDLARDWMARSLDSARARRKSH